MLDVGRSMFFFSNLQSVTHHSITPIRYPNKSIFQERPLPIPSFTLTKVLYWHYNLKRYDSSNHLEQVHYLRNRLS